MAEGLYALDDPSMRARLRKDFSSPRPGYRQRQIISPSRNLYLVDGIVSRPFPSKQSGAPNKSLAKPGVAPLTANLPTPNGTALQQPDAANLEEQPINPAKYRSKVQYIFIVLAVAMILLGGYISFIGWRSNRLAQVQAAKLTEQANRGSSSVAPSTVQPSAKTVASYVVAPTLPRYLIIPKLGVDARIFSVGLTKSGALATPNNVFDTAWYNESAEPGQPGAMLIDGHVSSWTSHGVFYGLKTLVAGDIVKVQRGDGTMFTYKVVKSQVYNSNNVDMQAAMTPVVEGKPGLNLITCTGDVIPGTNEFNKRIIVYTEQE